MHSNRMYPAEVFPRVVHQHYISSPPKKTNREMWEVDRRGRDTLPPASQALAGWVSERLRQFSCHFVLITSVELSDERIRRASMDRIVRQISPPLSKDDEERTRRFSSFDDQPNIVLLGDPGAGKSHTFEAFARASGGRLVTVRSFLVTPAVVVGRTLFIDGLDERRAGRSDRDTVDELVEKLFAVGPEKVRISCRAADWLGDSDLAALRPYFETNGGGTPVVLLLERLSGDEQCAVLADQGMSKERASSFIAEAEFAASPTFSKIRRI